MTSNPDPRVVEVPCTPQDLDAFTPLVGEQRAADLAAAAAATAEGLAGRTVWNVNSTATGGGVAEMLGPLVAYGRGAGVDARWLVIQGEPAFFDVTKRLHNLLHGQAVGAGLSEDDARTYRDVVQRNLPDLQAVVRRGDIVLLHDPQTAGLASALRDLGAMVVWRSHIGTDDRNDQVDTAWEFLRPHVEAAHHWVFSRPSYVPDFLDRDHVTIIQPSVDPFSPKNRDLSAQQVHAIVAETGVISDGWDLGATYTLRDGSVRRLDRAADLVRAGAPPPGTVPLVVQVSRWDRLKDPVGVMTGFAEHAIGPTDAHLALVGPSVTGVADDPEGAEVMAECIDTWRALPSAARRRIQLVTLPMRDQDENAAMVNAIQRHAAIVVQKSLREGFGLTVSEAMLKGRPVIGGAVGGITDQVVHGETGLLVDPTDLDAFGASVVDLLTDPHRAGQMGKAARDRAIEHFTGPRHLLQYADLFARLVEAG